METSHHFRYSSAKCEEEMVKVEAQAVEWKDHILHLAGRDVLPVYLRQLFKCCLSGGSFVSTATFEDLNVFVDACADLKLDMKHAATTIQRASRVPRKAVFAKLTLWRRMYHQEGNKATVAEEKADVIKIVETKPVTVVTKHRSFKPSITSKKNRARRQTTLSSMRKNKKAANLARRRGLVTVTAAPSVQQAPVRAALIPYAPSAPIKKKKSSITTYLSRPIKLEPSFELVQMISILSKCALTSITEVYEPIEYEYKCTLSKYRLNSIIEEEEPEEMIEVAKVEATTTTKPEEIKVEAITSSDSTTELAQILPIEQEPKVEATAFVDNVDDGFWDDDELTQPYSSQPSQLEQEADADDDIYFEQVDEPLLDIPEATSESIQSPKKQHSRRCKAVESSLDGRYWSVATRRRRRSSRVRSKPNFYTPS